MSAVKEPLYFARHADTVWRGPGDYQAMASLEMYLELYAAADPQRHRFAGEASTLYLATPDAPERIRALASDARVVAVLRHPLDRAWSHFVQHRSQGREPCARFMDAVAQEERRMQDGWAPFWGYTGLSRYADQLERWRAHFPAAQLGVFLFDDLATDADGFMSRLLDFLGLEPGAPCVAPVTARNEAYLPRSLGFARAVADGDGHWSALMRAVLPLPWRAHIKWLLQRANGRPPAGELTPGERARLVGLFDADIGYVERLLQRDLPDWRR